MEAVFVVLYVGTLESRLKVGRHMRMKGGRLGGMMMMRRRSVDSHVHLYEAEPYHITYSSFFFLGNKHN